MRCFASDNASGIHPSVLEALARANEDHAIGYGQDPWTEAALARFREHFGPTTEALLVFGGTGANVVGLRTVCDSHEAIVCAESSHLWRDECAAPERFLGSKLIPVATTDGKLAPDAVRPLLRGFGVVHHAQPRVISLSQPTEWGTLYSRSEIRAFADLARRHDMLLHVDGARLANAAAALEVPLAEFGPDAGIDVISFGGTKNGLLGAEAVLLFDPRLTGRAHFFRKQAMQLASKQRFLAAQFDVLLADRLWLTNAQHANAMARRLADAILGLPGVELAVPVETNAVFCRLPTPIMAPLQEAYPFLVWDQPTATARLMTSWDTREEDVLGFRGRLAALLEAAD